MRSSNLSLIDTVELSLNKSSQIVVVVVVVEYSCCCSARARQLLLPSSREEHHLPVHVCNMHATISQKQCSSLSIPFDLWNYCTRLGTLSTIVIFAFSLRKLKKAMINRWKETDPLCTIVKSYVSFHGFWKQMSCYCEVALVATFRCWDQP